MIPSVLVGLWYIEKSILLFTLEINMSRNGYHCEYSSSMVNVIESCKVLRWSKNLVSSSKVPLKILYRI